MIICHSQNEMRTFRFHLTQLSVPDTFHALGRFIFNPRPGAQVARTLVDDVHQARIAHGVEGWG